MEDEYYMRRALDLARRGWGMTSPNPMVGAVIVKGGRIIGEGFHRFDGGPHAEIECLRSCSESPEGAAMYVTLEPCSTRGRTGACTDAIIKAKISSVKIGASDPNPAHSGRAGDILRAHGISAEFGILGDECESLNFIYNHAVVQKRALVALKCAASSDGKIASSRGVRTQITSPASMREAMRWRARFDSIGIGFGTLVSDNPKLNVRGFSLPDYPGPKSPVRLIFDSSLRLASMDNLGRFEVFSDADSARTRVVCSSEASDADVGAIQSRGISVLKIPADKSSKGFWELLAGRLYRGGISSLLLEGGAGLWESACAARAVDYCFEYKAVGLSLGPDAFPAFRGGRPFSIAGKFAEFGSDTLEMGRPIWIRNS